MHPGQRFVREHRARRLDSSLLGQRNRQAPGGFTRLGFEPLEERAMLSVSQDLLDELLPYQTAINTALDVMTSLPLVGEQFADLQEFNTILQDSLASLASHVDSLTNGHFELAIPLPSFSETFTFDLGLDAFLQFSSAGGVQASINPVLNVAFDITGGEVSLDADDSYLDIGFGLSLPNFTATASLNGLLHTEVADAGTVFAGHVELHFTEMVGIEVELSGSANIRFDLDLYFIDPDLDAPFNPHFSTRLDLVWGFNTATDQLAAPQIALRNFSLDADGFFNGFLGDVLTTVQKFTGPMQPFIDVFDEPIPILSAFDGSETIGDLFLKGSGLSEEQQDRFELMVHIIRTVNTIDLSGSSGGAKINFGDIGLTGNPMQAGAFGFDTSQLTNGFQQIINLPELGHVEETLTKLASYTGIVSTAGLRFPLIENPDDVVAAILTGQIEPLFTFDTGRLHFELEASIGVGIKDILGIFLSAGITFDAQLAMGYDTAGLLKLIQTHNPADLLHGFYFDNSVDTLGPPVPNVPNPKKTGLYLQGHAKLEATAIVTISGGLYANIAVELASTDTSSHVHLDSMISNLASGAKVFNLSGAFYAAANISLELPNPVGPDITVFDFELARYDLINNDPPPPATFDRPLSVIDVTNQHTLALDVTKMGAGYTTQVRPVHNVSVSIDGTVKEVDGIRVDYASEIVIYVMRKDDVTTNYYNLITLSGTPADRTSISIQDPFNVFEDEGAPNPAPSQTEPTIVLVGGTSVAYHYADSSNRSNPTVLLAGGRGFNHLTGGTMMFGNFIPAARIDQAKNHLGNISGIDAAGLGLVYSQIDAAVLPASTAGIIGANITGSRGGLMLGGVGANSFVANGPGHFEMIGGPWENNFTIRPSFGGVPATYDIDGGGGNSQLNVYVPAGDLADFESSAVADRYRPQYRALDVYSNAGLFATAHGIHNVRAIGVPGSEIILGDTSLVNIEFEIRGSGDLKFGGSPLPDYLNVAPVYEGTAVNNYATARHRFPPFSRSSTSSSQLTYYSQDVYLTGVTFVIARTFGTTGLTQYVPFAPTDALSSSITLDGRGASDDYFVTTGYGAFIDITISDSDETTQNDLVVQARDASLLYQKMELTDTYLGLEYYTAVRARSQIGGTFDYLTSVAYTPTFYFDDNTNIEFHTSRNFNEWVVNRPVAPQKATIITDTLSFPGQEYAFELPIVNDPFQPNRVFDFVNSFPRLDVLANAGELNLFIGAGKLFQYDVLGNTGTIAFDFSRHWPSSATSNQVNIASNAGTINVTSREQGVASNGPISTQVNVGSAGSLHNISGNINLNNDAGGILGLRIDDHANGTSGADWSVTTQATVVGDLTINYAGVNSQPFYSYVTTVYEALPAPGKFVDFQSIPPFATRVVNGVNIDTTYVAGGTQYSQAGVPVSVPISYSAPPGAELSFSATNLPPGLSINPSTGVITGTIGPGAAMEVPYEATLIMNVGGAFSRSTTVFWYVSSGIDIIIPPALFNRLLEGTAPPADPLTATNKFGLPVTFSVTGLPPGITYNPASRQFGGTLAAGATQGGPYETTITATDGHETAQTSLFWWVTGLMIEAPATQRNAPGDSVNLPLPFSTPAGAVYEFTAFGLPAGLAIDPTTGVISGTIAADAAKSSETWVTLTSGDDVAFVNFPWLVLPEGVSNYLELSPLSNRHVYEGEWVFFSLDAYNSLDLLATFTAEGLPPGLSLSWSEGAYVISGYPEEETASATPYQVTVTMTDGIWSDTESFEMFVGVLGTVRFFSSGNDFFATPFDLIANGFPAISTLGETITYSATGLPPGLSINPESGHVGEVIELQAATPGIYQVTVTATAASDTAYLSFLFHVFTSYEGPHVAVLAHPEGATVTLRGPQGSDLRVSLVEEPGAATPGGTQFPLGFIDFTLRGLEPGQAADITIDGLDLTGLNDYLKFGPTPDNPTNHWYSFLAGAIEGGAGAEFMPDGTIVLHLVDGGIGDDDLTMNGVIVDIGGPAITGAPPELLGDYSQDAFVDAKDYTFWRNSLGTSVFPYSGADGNGNGIIDAADYLVWKAHYGENLAGGALQLAPTTSSSSTPPATSVPGAVTDSAATPTTPVTATSSAISTAPETPPASPIEALPDPLEPSPDLTTTPLAPGTLDRLFAGWSGAERFRAPHRATLPLYPPGANPTANPLQDELLSATTSRVDRRSAPSGDHSLSSADWSEAHDGAFGEWEGAVGQIDGESLVITLPR